MAARFDASGDSLTDTANLPTVTAFTWMAWAKISVDRNNYSQFFTYDANNSDEVQAYIIGTASDGTTLDTFNGLVEATGSALTVGTWYHLAATVSGTSGANFLVYLNGTLDISANARSVSPTKIWLGNDAASEFLNGSLAAVKIWDAVLTAQEILQEKQQYLPCRTANLNRFYPLINSQFTTDHFNKRTLTQAGILALEAGPPIPWRMNRRSITQGRTVTGGGPPIIHSPLCVLQSVPNAVSY